MAYFIKEMFLTLQGEGMNSGRRAVFLSAFLVKHYGGNYVGAGVEMRDPMSTVTAVDHHGLATAHLLKFHGSSEVGQCPLFPAPTVRAQGTHLAEVRAFLTQYNGMSDAQPMQLSLGTVTTKARFGLVHVHGEPYEITDIGLRMLQPRELFRAQGFDDSYVIDVEYQGKPLTKEAQIRMCGNSVSPWMAYAIVSANVGRKAVVAA